MKLITFFVYQVDMEVDTVIIDEIISYFHEIIFSNFIPQIPQEEASEVSIMNHLEKHYPKPESKINYSLS